MSAVLIVVAAVAGLVGLLRWLRVSQREHYLPGQVARTARRWAAVRPPNQALALVWLVAVVATIAAGVTADDSVVPAVAGLVAVVLGTIFPVGMSLLGKVRLKPTRRAVVQGVFAVVVAAVIVALVALAAGGGDEGAAVAAAVVPLVVLLAVDVAAWLRRPLERRKAAGFERQAREKLEKIAPTVIAVTGSYGKTTVKNHVRDLLVGSFTTVASPASWNNQAGLSRAVNEHVGPDTEVFVAEMGTYGRGEIRRLVEWVRPGIAIISAIGPVHLERMGSLERITEAKSEILEGAEVAILNVDHPQLDALADDVAGDRKIELWRVGTDWSRAPDLDVLAERKDDDVVVTVRGEELARVPGGSLHAGNVACAVAAALAAGVVPAKVAAALPSLAPPPNRAEPLTTENGITVVDDTFNSNPAGARAAFESLQRLAPAGRHVVVTPGMVELGDAQVDANRELASLVAHAGADLVVVGWTNRAALMSGHPTADVVRDRERARQWVRANLRSGDAVLWENDLPDHYP